LFDWFLGFLALINKSSQKENNKSTGEFFPITKTTKNGQTLFPRQRQSQKKRCKSSKIAFRFEVKSPWQPNPNPSLFGENIVFDLTTLSRAVRIIPIGHLDIGKLERKNHNKMCHCVRIIVKVFSN
jgi:hypothetical protein